MAVKINVVWADNTKDLQKHLAEGLNQIVAVEESAKRMVQSLSGEKLIASAHRITAALHQMGGEMGVVAGAAKLTE